MIRILGLDPGLAETGFGIIDVQGSRYFHICHGVISTPADMDIGKRLNFIYNELVGLVKKFSPNEAGIENLYFAKNITSAFPVAQARGVALLVLAQQNVPTGNYPPQMIKQAIVGHGRAEKHQIQELVRMLLGLQDPPKPDHAADALAAAICHANSRGGALHVQ
jgi:crossover junction endodeoxyribonuclease RuvC